MHISIIITNYNYNRYLPDAIDSALAQTFPDVEVIVVDDGSTDNSHEIIARYADRIIPVLKENGGMGSTYNTGLTVSRGEIILFLDADDMLYPTVAEKVAHCFEDASVTKAHWPLDVINESGVATGEIIPAQPLAEGDFRDAIIRIGPDAYLSPPTTGNAWRRSFLESVLPMPEPEFRQHADIYLCTLAPIFGTIRCLPEPLGLYRIHGANDYACSAADEKLRRNMEIYSLRCAHLERFLTKLGISADPEAWKKEGTPYSWMQRLSQAIAEIKSVVPEGNSYILADAGERAERQGGSEFIQGRRSFPFTENNGQYWGPPVDDEGGIREIERLRESGAAFIVFGWPAFWWLEYYQGMAKHLDACYRSLHVSERVVIYVLRSAP